MDPYMNRVKKYKFKRINKEVTIGVVSAAEFIDAQQKTNSPLALLAMKGMSDEEKDVLLKEITATEYFEFVDAVNKFNNTDVNSDEFKKK